MDQTVNSKKIILSNGFLLGLTTIAIAVIMYVTGLVYTMNWLAGVIGFLAMIAFIVLGIANYKKENNTYISLGQAMKIGVGVALIAGIIGAVYQYVFLNYIDTEYLSKMMEIQQQQMIEKNPNLTQEQLDMAASMGETFSSPGILFGIGIISNLFFGFIIALIAGLAMKKTEDSF